MSEAIRFLEFIHGDTSRTIIRATGKKYNGKQFTIKVDEIERRKDDLEIFFLPCRGGITNEKINDFPCVYADADVGKDANGNYFPEEVVRELKEQMLERLRSSPLPPPSTTNEGRNGFHFYWRLSDRPDVKTWRFIQERIRTVLNSDWAVERPNQPMRLPGTTWRKTNGGNHPEYTVSIIEQNDTFYTSQELVDLLRDVEVAPREAASSASRKPSESPAEIDIDWNNPMISAISDENVEFLQKELKATPRRFQNYGEVHHYLTHEVSLEGFLGIEGKRCRCPFHDDHEPSAGIKRLRSGEDYFKCFSCEVSGNIKKIVQVIRGCSPAEAYAFLLQVFMIEQTDTQWQTEQKGQLDSIACRIRETLSNYECVYKNVAHDLPVYEALIDTARKNTFSEEYTSAYDGRPIFFVSMRHIAEVVGFSHARINRAIVNLALHGLIHRCGDDEIPEFLLEKSKLYRKSKLEFARSAERISYYTISNCTDDELQRAEEIAQRVQQARLTRAGLSYEGVYRTFGEEIADRVYVLREGRPLSDASEERNDLVLDLLDEQIEDRGWTCEADIVQGMIPKWNCVIAERQVKRSLPAIIADNLRRDGKTGYIRVRLNKALKGAMGINTKGYGEIILLRDDYDRVLREVTVQHPHRRRGRPRKNSEAWSSLDNDTP